MTFQQLRYVKYSVVALLVALQGARMVLPPSWDLSPARASPDQTMRAIVYKEHGDASVLQFDLDHPRPVPYNHQVLVQIHASGLNPVDFKLRRNAHIPTVFLPLPKIPGADIAGVVVDPNQSTKFAKGDRVAAMLPMMGARWGAHADYVAVDESFLAKINKNDDTTTMDWTTAAAYPLAALTVLQDFRALALPLLEERELPPKILIQAGAGGVGTFAIQYAKHVLGMYVATTASKPKEAFLKELGADLVIDYHTQNFEDVVQDYDVVLDPMSWLYEERTLNSKVLKPTGHYLNVPSSDWSFVNGIEKSNGPTSFWNLIQSKVKNFLWPGSTPKYSMVFVNPSGEDLQIVLDLIANGTIRPIVDKKFHLSQAVQAHKYLEQGNATGKVVLYHTEAPESKTVPEAEAINEEETIDPTIDADTESTAEEPSAEEEQPQNQGQEEQPPLEQATE